MTLHHIELHN